MLALRSIAPGFALALVLGASLGAKAAPIGPGFDLFATGPSTFTIHLTQPCVTSCTLVFQSLTIGPGNTDTIVQRTGSLAEGATGPLALAVAPDPPTVFLLGAGLVGLGIAGRRRALRH